MSSRIEVESIFSGFEWDSAKFHIAQRAGEVQPIDVFTRSFDEEDKGPVPLYL